MKQPCWERRGAKEDGGEAVSEEGDCSVGGLATEAQRHREKKGQEKK